MAEQVENGHDITQTLGQWYDLNQRDLPWRKTNNPYHIWLSEIILQQTRVDQGMPYYLKFIHNFPDIQSLALASEDEVLKLWQGLGYYSRARNLHFTAKHIANELQGEFPKSFSELIKLKGIGQYTGSAIASIAFNEPVAAIDGNVIRVISRLFGITKDVNQRMVQKQIESLATQLLDGDRPGRHNQAMMEFGATHCTPQKPQCATCPLQENCVSLKLDLVLKVPMKSKKVKRKSRYFHYIVAQDAASNYLLEQRTNKDIWHGLYQFPLIETSEDSELNLEELESFLKSNHFGIQKINEVKKHILSHQDIYTRFYHLQIGNQIGKAYRSVAENEIDQFALPRLIDRYLEEHDLRTGNAVLND